MIRPVSNPQVVVLSRRERQVLAGHCRGWSADEIARAAGISRKTVKNYFDLLVRQLGLRKSQLAVWGHQNAAVFAPKGEGLLGLHPAWCPCQPCARFRATGCGLASPHSDSGNTLTQAEQIAQ